MSDTVIRVENLSKKYVLSHQQEGQQYKALRDVIADGAKAVGRTLLKPSKAALNPSREEFWALKDVSFEIKQGDRVGIIGRNGAGKSTLLKILSRIMEPTSGSIRIRGRVASLLEVGTGFHPELTGRENIFLNGAILGMGKEEIKRKFDEIVAFAEVEKFLDTPVKRYSSGMYVRLAFAVAAHLEPEILIVDEVLAVGDAQFQKKCMGKMEDVAEREGRTVIFVSHNMAAVRKLCNQGVALKAGEVIKVGAIEDVISYYAFQEITSSNYPDSKNRTQVRIKSIDYFVKRLLVDSVASGEDISISIKLEYLDKMSGNLTIGIAVENSHGDFMMINYSNFHEIEFQACSGIFSAKIKKVPWVPGIYQIHLRILLNDKEIYWNPNVKTLQVESGDFFRTGHRGEESLCFWLQDIDWSAEYGN